MGRMKKEDYLSDEYKQMKEELKQKEIDDREMKLAENAIKRIPEHRRPYVLKILSAMYATKTIEEG